MGYGKKAGGKPVVAKKKAVKKVGVVKKKKSLRQFVTASVDFEPPFEKTEKKMEFGEDGRQPLTEDNLTEGHKMFCLRFAIHGSGCKASREAGFNEHYYIWALKQSVLMGRIEQIRAERRNKFTLSADRVIGELTKVAFSNVDDFVELQQDGNPIINCSKVGRDEMASLSSIEQDIYHERGASRDDKPIPIKRTKIKFHDKLKALEMLCRNLKLFKDEEIDAMTPEDKARKIREALLAMARADGEKVVG